MVTPANVIFAVERAVGGRQLVCETNLNGIIVIRETNRTESNFDFILYGINLLIIEIKKLASKSSSKIGKFLNNRYSYFEDLYKNKNLYLIIT
jgi:hypothetical protein